MRWVYVLCCEHRTYFVGETNDIADTLRHHIEGKESIFTRMYTPLSVMGLYRVENNVFFKYNFHIHAPAEENRDDLARWLEHSVAQQLIDSFSGNVYTRLETPADSEHVTGGSRFLPNRPTCNCGLPCDIFQDGDSFWYGCPATNLICVPNRAMGRLFAHNPCDFVVVARRSPYRQKKRRHLCWWNVLACGGNKKTDD